MTFLLIALDQVTKGLALTFLKGQEPFVIWDGVFELRYLENRGAAFGMLQGQRAFFSSRALWCLRRRSFSSAMCRRTGASGLCA